MEDEDFAFALSLQDEFISVNNDHTTTKSDRKRERSTSIVDESWETIDPTPDIRQLFLEFNDTYFEGKLAGCEVKWSPRMTLCAGVCCYEGRGGLCSIKLSLPLLKLRPRRDLVQTLLHEMIHALLFVTHNNKDHNAHGPEFHKHMYNINKQSGTNITVYHNFHDEVDLYRQHWWRCNGPCQKRPPYYGMLKRAMNRAPSERDPWWAEHQQKCGGTYTKVKEPEDYGKKKRKVKDETDSSSNKSTSKGEGMPKIYELWKNENTSDGHAVTKDKENNMQKSNVERALAVIPFTGKGAVLGTCKSESSTKTKPWLTEIRTGKVDKNVVLDLKQGPIIKNSDNSGPSYLNVGFKYEPEKNNEMQLQKVKVHGKVKKKKKNAVNVGELTIVDAFKRVEKKSAIIIIDDSPAKSEVSPSNLVVPCPVCQTNIEKNLINLHLDSCLL